MNQPIVNSTGFEYFDTSNIHPKVLDHFNDLVNQILNYDPPKKTFFYKTGSFTGKTLRFLKRAETKSAVLLGHWAAETVVVLGAASAFYLSGNFSAMMLLVAIAAYGTYALFSILSNQKV